MVERAKREDGERFAIARIEQLYPSPIDEIKAEIARYPNLKAVRWVQDEPQNMGPWPHYQLNVWPRASTRTVEPVTRPASSSPSVGTAKRHTEEQKALIAAAFDEPSEPSAPTSSTTTEPGRRVLHRPRHRGARASAGVTRRSPWPGSPSGSRSSPTPTRSSRPPVERLATWLARLGRTRTTSARVSLTDRERPGCSGGGVAPSTASGDRHAGHDMGLTPAPAPGPAPAWVTVLLALGAGSARP